MISASTVSTITLTYSGDNPWTVFDSSNLATGHTLQVNWNDLASQLNNIYRPLLNSAVNEISNMQNMCKVYNNADQIVSSSANTVLSFNSERYGTSNMHSTATNTSKIYAPGTGYYDIGGNVSFAANTDGRRSLGIKIGGSVYVAYQQAPATTDISYINVHTPGPIFLNSGDYAELYVYQTCGTSLTCVYAEQYSPEFAMKRVY
jgi:hypothetical protein